MIIAGVLVAALSASAGMAAGLTHKQVTQAGLLVPDPPTVQPLDAIPVSVPGPAVPLDDDASAGKVVFTFDDGPDCYTPALLAEMAKLHVAGVFFVFGYKVDEYPSLVRQEVRAGNLVEPHTFDHLSFTGASTDTAPLPPSKIAAELTSTVDAITVAGAPVPHLYRPPYGDITAADNQIAAALGLRIVQPFSVVPDGSLVDSGDWRGYSPATIAHQVEYGYWAAPQGHWIHLPGLADGARVAGFHDSGAPSCMQGGAQGAYPVNTIRALPLIVAWMNAHHLGVTTTIPADTTGGAVPDIRVPQAGQ
jgi:peptidoglycan/xylan/chitin deacetylase (PgdA/CDA1 family)